MIIPGSRLTVVDNSGARKVRCLKVYRVKPKGYGTVGSTILVSVRSLSPKIQAPKVQVGSLYKAVILQTAKPKKRMNGTYVTQGKNLCVLLNQQNAPLGTRVHSSANLELKKSHTKILSLAPKTI